MTKNQLIKALESIPGNPEVFIYDCIVEDLIKPYKPELITLTKLSFKHYKEVCIWQASKDKDFKVTPEYLEHLQKMYKKVIDWKINSEIYPENLTLLEKQVIVISKKEMGKSSWSRGGTIHY